MAADPLSDVLSTVRLTGAVYYNFVAHDPWVAEQGEGQPYLDKILPGAGHLISYHVVTEGRCYSNPVDGTPIPLEAGQVIVYTRGEPHVMASRPGLRADPNLPNRLEALTGQLPLLLNYGGEGPVTAKFVCGFLACDAQPFNPLIGNLPPVIVVGDKDGKDAGWIGAFVALAAQESAEKRAGGETVLAKLSELMFIEVVRRYIQTLPPEQTGWLAGLRDPAIGKALSLLHESPARDWTIEDLAREVGHSRSVLAERFVDLVGLPPIQYLAKWRMQLAAGMLSAGTATMATIAQTVGYGSEAAFSRAFKKLVGVPPSPWRHRGGG